MVFWCFQVHCTIKQILNCVAVYLILALKGDGAAQWFTTNMEGVQNFEAAQVLNSFSY